MDLIVAGMQNPGFCIQATALTCHLHGEPDAFDGKAGKQTNHRHICLYNAKMSITTNPKF